MGENVVGIDFDRSLEQLTGFHVIGPIVSVQKLVATQHQIVRSHALWRLAPRKSGTGILQPTGHGTDDR